MKSKQLLSLAPAAVLLWLLSVPVFAADGAPIAENMELSTYRGVSMEGQLKAIDPEGDALTFQITTPPVKGELLLDDDGSFVYTPGENKRGKDYFGYTATDADGNVSQEATVIISLVKQTSGISYEDMKGTGGYCDALRLAEAGVFVGEQIGGKHLFSPTAAVTRGEFLAMCMELSGTELLSGVSSTGFSDDHTIPVWQKRYVATALMVGCISGADAQFDALSPITCEEAAVMVSDVFRLSNVPVSHMTEEAVPTAQAVANLIACHILPAGCDTAQTLNRGMAADILSGVMDVLANRT